jgi:exodeoxyribonuclease VII large subunit
MSIEIYSVSQLTKLIKDILESNFYGIWVEGEISSLRYSSTGHLYFSLVDEDALIGVIIYRNRLKNIKVDLENGMKVTVFGSIGLYLKGGEYRIIAEHIRESGKGKKFYDLEKLKKEFKAKGYFDRKRKIKENPINIILITSINGAALFDMLNILKRRAVGLNIYIYPVTVQGDAAEQSILSALLAINKIEIDIDAVILARGGGSNEDLWVFNSPNIAKGLFDVKFPTISAIGHEIDYTLCDFVADLRAETPSAAAEIITQSRYETKKRLNMIKNSISISLSRVLSLYRERLGRYSGYRNYLRIRSFISNRYMMVDGLQNKMQSRIISKINYNKLAINALRNRIDRKNPNNLIVEAKEKNRLLSYKINQSIGRVLYQRKNILEMLEYKIISQNPKNILQKGYTITTDAKGKPIKSAGLAIKQDLIKTHFYDGVVESLVKKD